MGQKQVLDRDVFGQAGIDIANELPVAAPAPGVDQNRPVAQAYKVNGGIARPGQIPAADLP
jgi:hypothetical protein